VKLGVALGGHSRSFEELRELVVRAERLGYTAVFVDGDVSIMESRGDDDVLDGWTVTAALLACTERIGIGSIRLVHHWNAARLAQAAASLDRIAPGRLHFLIGIGGQPADRRFGLPALSTRERIAWLDETLAALRALWKGDEVTCKGRYVQLDRARVRPVPPPGRLPLAVAARDGRTLAVLARRADVWDVNLPPVRARVEAAAETLDRACRAAGREPGSLGRQMWIFVRPGRDPEDPQLAREFRRANPWFRDIPDEELPEAIVSGSPGSCRDRLVRLSQELRLDLPILDCSYLRADATRQILDALAPSAPPP
jgi:alkanesulfonate monooxygenase SsuD/methylene tetrahydromethanopterin reductase-like flavin-dependent oxidoreductase (luciferase family)